MNKAAYIFMMAPVAGLVAQAEPVAEPRDEHGRTPLMRALAHHTMPPLVQIKALIDAGAAVNARDTEGNTPLMYVPSLRGYSHEEPSYLPVVKLLVESGADVHALNPDGLNLLELAVCQKDTEDAPVVEYLQSFGLQLSLNGQLAAACAQNNVPRVKELLAAGADPNFARAFSLYICMGVGTHYMPHDAEIVQLLLAAGANPNLRVRDLMFCCTHGGPSMLPLLEAGMHIRYAGDEMSAADFADVAARSWCTENGFPKLVFSRLIRMGADINACSRQYPPLCYSASKHSGHGRRHIAYLLSIGADPSLKDSQGRTALDIAREHGRTDIIPLLENPQALHPATTYGVDVPTKFPRCGGTPLTRAASQGDYAQVQALIEAGADLEALSDEWAGSTALANALLGKHHEVVLHLKDAEANTEKVHFTEFGTNTALHELRSLAWPGRAFIGGQKRGFRGRTPLMLVAHRGLPEVLSRLIYDSEVNATDAEGNTAMHHSNYGTAEHIECARKLVAAGADINARNHKGETPLHRAEGIGWEWGESALTDAYVRYLLSAGADAHACTAYGMNALELAMCQPNSWPHGSLNPVADSPNPIVPLLVEQGLSCSQNALLIGAAAADDVAAVKRLLGQGANPNAYGPHGPHALAACQGNLFVLKEHDVEITELLLAAGANPTLATQQLLQHVYLYMRPQTFPRLFQAGWNVLAAPAEQLREYMAAAHQHRPEIHQLFVQHGAPAWNAAALAAELRAAIENSDSRAVYRVHNDYFPMDTPLPGTIPSPFADGKNTGGHALILAAALGKADMLRILLCSCNIEATDAAGRTAIEYAAANGYDDIVYLLLNAGAKRVREALHLAEQYGYPAVAGLLRPFVKP